MTAQLSDDLPLDEVNATALLDGPLPMVPHHGDRSGLIDQAYSEYKHLCIAGVEVDPDAFCARFPAYQTSLRRLLEVHRELEADPTLWRGLDRWPEIGDEFFGFQLESELGRGAFARVFLARETAVGNRQVVVKVSLHADDEAGTLGKLRHPNVVPIHSAQFDPETGFAIVCMPFLGGTTLLPLIETLSVKKALPERADVVLRSAKDDRWPADSAAAPARVLRRGSYLDGVLYLGERLANALAYVHERGILHRDLKPSNVLLCPNGEPVLIDFNLALDRTMTEHRLGGTLPYMPPEQLEHMSKRCKGEPAPADHRGDIFALGVILYEMLTGAHPFGPVPLKLKTAEARDFLIRRQRRGPLPLRSRNKSVDPAIDRLISRCLSADPAQRPASAREMAAELRRLQAPTRRARRWAVAHIKAVVVAAAIVMSGAAAAGYAATLPSQAEQHREKGLALYRNGDWQAAAEQFTASILADTNQPAVYFMRGRASQMMGELELARWNYMKADLGGDARAAASVGYCEALLGGESRAIQWFEKAIRDESASPAVHNNLAFCLGRIGNKRDGLAKAEDQATEAIRKDPGLRAAYYNRAAIRLLRLGQGASAAAGLADAKEAISRGGEGTAQLYYVAASLCAAQLFDVENPSDDPLYAEGQEFLAKAVAYGYARKNLCRFSEKIRHMADWSSQLGADEQPVRVPTGTDEAIRLVDPFVD